MDNGREKANGLQLEVSCSSSRWKYPNHAIWQLRQRRRLDQLLGNILLVSVASSTGLLLLGWQAFLYEVQHAVNKILSQANNGHSNLMVVLKIKLNSSMQYLLAYRRKVAHRPTIYGTVLDCCMTEGNTFNVISYFHLWVSLAAPYPEANTAEYSLSPLVSSSKYWISGGTAQGIPSPRSHLRHPTSKSASMQRIDNVPLGGLVRPGS